MYTNIETRKSVSYNEFGKCEKIETYVDGDLFESIERYYDKEGHLIYEYTHDKTASKLAMEHKQQNTKQSKKKESRINKTLKKNRKRY